MRNIREKIRSNLYFGIYIRTLRYYHKEAKQLDINEHIVDEYNTSHKVYKIISNNTVKYFKECNKEKSGKYDILDLNRAVAYEKLAKLLGLENLVPHTERMVAAINNQLIPGVMVDEADGRDIWFVSKKDRINKITPLFQKTVTDLQLLDFICHEQDHSLNNYYPVEDEKGFYVSLCAFDNGGNGSFNIHGDLSFGTYYGCTPFIGENHELKLPWISMETLKTVGGVNFDSLFHCMFPYLSLFQILFVWYRICALKKIVNNQIACGNLELLRETEWTNQTIEEELSGKYGNTYLFSLVNEWGAK